jgi:hypothetical protein
LNPRSTHDHPAAALVDRIVDQAGTGLGSEGRSVSDRATALFSSMFSIVVLCDETLLQHNILRKITFEDEPWVFAQRLFAAWPDKDVVPANVGQFLRFLRNGLAHGNVNLEPSRDLVGNRDLGVTFERPADFRFVESPDFNGIVVWEDPPRRTGPKSEAILSIGDMWSVIMGLQAMVHDKRNWSHQAKQWAAEDWRWTAGSCDGRNV